MKWRKELKSEPLKLFLGGFLAGQQAMLDKLYEREAGLVRLIFSYGIEEATRIHITNLEHDGYYKTLENLHKVVTQPGYMDNVMAKTIAARERQTLNERKLVPRMRKWRPRKKRRAKLIKKGRQ